MKSIIIGVIVIVIVIGIVFYSKVKTSEAPINDENGIQNDNPIIIDVKTYTLVEIATHNNKDDCWLLLHGNVYDVTEFIPNHPGGAAILQGCGKDATSLFESRPGSGTAHSDIARSYLPNFYIGELAAE